MNFPLLVMSALICLRHLGTTRLGGTAGVRGQRGRHDVAMQRVRDGEQGNLGGSHGARAAGLGGTWRRQGVGDQMPCEVGEEVADHGCSRLLRYYRLVMLDV
jgi:hypothetical protein